MQKGTTTTGLLLSVLVVPGSLGISTVSVALPSLARDLGLRPSEAAWVLAAYVLALAVLVTVFGRVADARGVRLVLRYGAVLTAAGALLAASSPSSAPLLAGRLLQGAGAGALWVAAFGIVAARHPGLGGARVIGVVSAVLGIVSGLGPLIGGVLADVLSWRFVVAVPAVALAAARPAARMAPASGDGTPVDLVGAALVAALGAALIVLLQGATVAVAGGGVVAAVLLVRRVRHRPDGFLPAAVVGSRTFVLAALAALALFAAYLGLVFAAPLLLLRHGAWTATEVGLLLAPAAVVAAVCSHAAGRLVTVHGPFRVAAVNAALSVVGLVTAWAGDGAPAATAVAMAFVLTGFSAGHVALASCVPSTVAADVRNVAIGLYTFALRLGGAIGSAAVAGLAGPLGLPGAVAALAVLPAAAVVALAAPRAADA